MDYILFNIDNGDVLHLGRVMPAYPNESLGLVEEHLIFQYVPDIYRANELQEMKDAYLNRVHALSFFFNSSNEQVFTERKIRDTDFSAEIIESIKLSILSSPKEGSRIEYSAIGRATRPSLKSRAL